MSINQHPLTPTLAQVIPYHLLHQIHCVKPIQDSETEECISVILDILRNHKNLLIRGAGRKYGDPRITLTIRYHDKAKPQDQAQKPEELLTPETETAIEGWINQLNNIGIPPMVRYLHDIVFVIGRKLTAIENH